MKNNRNEPKQLDCQLNCKETHNLCKSIAMDIEKEDMELKDILNEINTKTQDNNSSSDCKFK